MTLRPTLLTLAVRDPLKSRHFYEAGLGLTPAAGSSEDIRFYNVGGVLLSLYGRRALAHDANVPAEGSGFGGFTIAVNTTSREEVDALLQRARTAGARVTKEPQEVFWGGYSGYFADPDGHLWEVAFNPYWIGPDGAIVLPT